MDAVVMIPSEARWMGGFTPPTKEFRLRFSKSMRSISREVEKEVRQTRSARSLADRGLIEFLGGEFDRSITSLEAAARRAPGDASVLSDLSAVYLARNESQGGPTDLILALEASDRAIQVNPYLPEALFNRALSFEKLFLTPDAIAAWEEVVRNERDPEWRQRAVKRLSSLQRPARDAIWASTLRSLERGLIGGSLPDIKEIVRDFPQEGRLYVEELLLGRWAEAILTGRWAEAERDMILARGFGRALAAQTGDQMLLAAVAVIDDAVASGAASSKVRNLAEAHAAFGHGLKAFERRDAETAIRHFHRAGEGFRYAGSPFSLWADFYLGAGHYIKPDTERALAIWEPLLVEVGEKQYLSLKGRIHWGIGLFFSVKGVFSSAHAHYERSIDLFGGIGEVENVAYLNYLLSEVLDAVGRADEAWEFRRRALSARSEIVNPQRLHNILYDVAEAILREGHATVALYFQNDLVDLAKKRGDPLAVCEAVIRRCRTLAREGSRNQVLSSLMKAREYVKLIPSEGLRQRMEAEILVAEGELIGIDDPGLRVVTLSKALNLYLDENYTPRRVQIYRLRSRAYEALGDLSKAEEDLGAALEEIERERGGISSGDSRRSHLDQARELFDEMVRLQVVERKDPLKALEYAERARSRSLLEFHAGSFQPLTPVDISARLPRGRTLIEYFLLVDCIIIWIVQDGVVETREVHVGSAELQGRLEALWRDLQQHGDDHFLKPHLEWLYQTLIAPVAHILSSGNSLLIVPDKELYRVPFSALLDEAGEFLIEKTSILICPAASLHIHLFESLRSKSMLSEGARGSVLIVADPEFDTLFALPRLPSSAREGHQVSMAYQDSRILLGKEAGEGRFASLAVKADVIHLGVHNIVEPRTGSSILLLAGSAEKGTDGLLSAAEVASMRLPETRVVVLASCWAGSGKISASEGVMSMARAFLATGVPSVIAGLWSVEDTIGARVFGSLHAVPGFAEFPERAVRSAQIKMLRDGVAIAHWGGIQVWGTSLVPASSCH